MAAFLMSAQYLLGDSYLLSLENKVKYCEMVIIVKINKAKIIEGSVGNVMEADSDVIKMLKGNQYHSNIVLRVAATDANSFLNKQYEGGEYLVYVFKRNNEYWVFEGEKGLKKAGESFTDYVYDKDGQLKMATFSREEYFKIIRSSTEAVGSLKK